MRRLALIAVPALAAVVLAVAGWEMLATARAAHVRSVVPAPPQAMTVPRGMPVPSIPAPPPYGMTCYVAGGRCSITPCVEFAGSEPAPVAAVTSAVVLRLARPVPSSRGAPAPGQPACPGRRGAPKILRVRGP